MVKTSREHLVNVSPLQRFLPCPPRNTATDERVRQARKKVPHVMGLNNRVGVSVPERSLWYALPGRGFECLGGEFGVEQGCRIARV